MKKLLLFLCSVLLGLSISGVAGATEYTTYDLDYLDGSRWYTWGIDMTIPEGETITNASLFFNNLDAYSAGDILWGDLLGSVDSGVHSIRGSDYGDHFSGQGTFLFRYQDYTPSTARDYTYEFNTSQIAALNDYAGDGNFGFGLDPDCHFSASGVTFSARTAGTSGEPVPEPTTMLLLGCGLAGLGFVRKKRQKA